MARGESGRIVIEIDPALKRELYAALAMSGSTLKDWFVRSAEEHCANGIQRSLFSNPRRLTSSVSESIPPANTNLSSKNQPEPAK